LDQLAEEAKRRPTETRVWCALAGELQGLGHFGAAREALDRARAVAAGAADLNTLGATLESISEPAAAVGAYREAIRLLRLGGEGVGPEQLELAYLGLGRALLAQEDADAAVLSLRVAVQSLPKASAAPLALAEALDRQGQLEEAQREAELAVDLDYDRSYGHRVLADISARLGRPRDRIEALRQLTVIAPEDVQAALDLAQSLSEDGDGTEALDLIQKVADQVPRAAEPLRRLGAAWSAVGEHTEAVRVLREAIRLEPADPTSHLALGEALLSARSPSEAVVALEAAAGLDPHSPRVLSRLGEMQLLVGQPRDAVRVLVRAAAIAPDDGGIRRILALALGQAGDGPAAAPELEGRLMADTALLPASQAVELLMRQGLTGRMRVEAADGQRGAIEMAHGRIVGAAFTPGVSLRSHLVRLGVDLSGLPVGLDELGSDLLEWLVDRRRADPERLRAALTFTARDVLERMAPIRQGTIEFEATREDDHAAPSASLDAVSVVIDLGGSRS
ncbi:MAG: tetratricopeptide repeat protein, partial [Myxococcota bacterium]